MTNINQFFYLYLVSDSCFRSSETPPILIFFYFVNFYQDLSIALGIYQRFLFRFRRKRHSQRVLLRLSHLLKTQAHFLHSHLVFVGDIDGADARIIGIDGSGDAVLQEGLERVGSVIGHSGGLHVAGEVGFDADLMLG